MSKVFLGLPSYGAVIGEATLSSFVKATKQNLIGIVKVQGFSILTHNFNMLYCAALNARAQGITHFCLLHADVIPQEEHWLDKMMEISQKHRADILSVVIPIKDGRGLTSTAIESENHWKPRRLSLKELFDREPTFTDPNILVNSGLMLVDIRNHWADKVFFRFEDRIVLNEKGLYEANTMSEDWNYSRDARMYDAYIYATREIKVVHEGRAHYSNAHAWGKE